MTSENQLNSPIRQQLQQNFEFIEKKLNDSKNIKSQINLTEKYNKVMAFGNSKKAITAEISHFEHINQT